MERKILNKLVAFGTLDSWEKSLLSFLKEYEFDVPEYTNKLPELSKRLNEIRDSNRTIYKNQKIYSYEKLLSLVYPEFVWHLVITQQNFLENTMTAYLFGAPAFMFDKVKPLNIYRISLDMGKSDDWNNIKEFDGEDKENIVNALNQIGYSGKTVYNNIPYSKNIPFFLDDIFKDKNIIWGVETIEQNCCRNSETILVAAY